MSAVVRQAIASINTLDRSRFAYTRSTETENSSGAIPHIIAIITVFCAEPAFGRKSENRPFGLPGSRSASRASMAAPDGINVWSFRPSNQFSQHI